MRLVATTHVSRRTGPLRAGGTAPTRYCSGHEFAAGHRSGYGGHGDVIVLEDLGSTNGTYLNEEPLRGPQPLHPGDRIRIGDSSFMFER